MNMEFPVINITVYLKDEYKNWENVYESIFTTEYIYTRNKKFLEFIKLCKFADNRGNIYTVEGFGKADFWRRIVPLSYRVPVIYKKTYQTIEFDKVRRLFLKRIDEVVIVSDEEQLALKKDMCELAEKAKDLKQLEETIF